MGATGTRRDPREPVPSRRCQPRSPSRGAARPEQASWPVSQPCEIGKPTIRSVQTAAHRQQAARASRTGGQTLTQRRRSCRRPRQPFGSPPSGASLDPRANHAPEAETDTRWQDDRTWLGSGPCPNAARAAPHRMPTRAPAHPYASPMADSHPQTRSAQPGAQPSVPFRRSDTCATRAGPWPGAGPKARCFDFQSKSPARECPRPGQTHHQERAEIRSSVSRNSSASVRAARNPSIAAANSAAVWLSRFSSSASRDCR